MKADNARITATAVTAGKTVTAVQNLSCVPFRFLRSGAVYLRRFFLRITKTPASTTPLTIGSTTHHTGGFVVGAVGAGVGLLSGFAVAAGAGVGLLLGFAVAAGAGVVLLSGFAVVAGAGVGLLLGFVVATGAGVGLLSGFAVAAGAGVGLPFGFAVAAGAGVGLLSGFGVAVGAGVAGAASFSKIALISTFPSGMVNLSFSIVTPPLTTCHSLK